MQYYIYSRLYVAGYALDAQSGPETIEVATRVMALLKLKNARLGFSHEYWLVPA